MPNNILITPGSASIQFSGSATNTIRLQVEPSGAISFYGNSGSLFGITDALSGSLMSVNDISGLPILEVFSDDRVVMGSFNTNTLVVTGSRVAVGTSRPSASLHVVGSMIVEEIIETVNVTASAPPATFNVDLTSGSIFFRSASTAANWTLNFRGNANLRLNDMLFNNQSITATILTINGATPYSASTYQIDGATITPRWQGGVSGSANANSLDTHQFTIIKIASASYQVLGSITRYT